MSLLPQSPKFFDLFEELASLAIKVASLLPQRRGEKKDWKKLASSASRLESKADDLCHRIHLEADKTFITPIDRDDIRALARNLDNVIDLVENVISYMYTYKVGRIPLEFYEFCGVTVGAIRQISHLVSDLKKKGNDSQETRAHIIAIHSLENKGDVLLIKALKYLFTNGTKPLTVIKWKDIFETLEQVLDECENTSDTVETIIVKNF